MSQPDVCVIYNPASGKGRGARRLERVRLAWRDRAAFWPTAAQGQAEELALQAAQAGFATVAAAGGDGTVHEVANGLLRSGRSDVVLAVLPAGSANDYAHSLGLDADWWQSAHPRIVPQPVDVGVVRANRRERFFVNGLGLGFNSQVNLQAKRIRFLQGMALYGLAVLHTLCFHYTRPHLVLHIDGADRSMPTLALSLAIGRREGNFVVAPEAVLDDGQFDFVHAGPLSRTDLVSLVPRLFAGRLPRHHPRLWMGRCRQVTVRSESPLAVHLDGEMFCVPADRVGELEVQLLPGRLRVRRRLLRGERESAFAQAPAEAHPPEP
jgi:diacylglycerol kinase family enzyme